MFDGLIIEFCDWLDFINNIGLRGGVMVMYGWLRIVFYKDVIFNFEGNICDDKGGVFYI